MASKSPCPRATDHVSFDVRWRILKSRDAPKLTEAIMEGSICGSLSRCHPMASCPFLYRLQSTASNSLHLNVLDKSLLSPFSSSVMSFSGQLIELYR